MTVEGRGGPIYSVLSTDTKPTPIEPTALLTETDTGDFYVWDGAVWNLIGGGAGHAEAHILAVTGPHTGTLPWADLNKTGSSLADLVTRAHANLSDAPADAHHPQSHGDGDHTAGFGVPTGAIDIGDAAAEGAATTHSRSDHQHAFPAPPAGYPQPVALLEADGAATTPARADHIHSHGSGYASSAHHSPFTQADADLLYDVLGGLATHVAAGDPHTAYQRESEKDAASGYAGLDASTALAIAQIRGLRETGGPTALTMGAVADGQFLKRSGATIVGAAAGGGGDAIQDADADTRVETEAAADEDKVRITTAGVERGLFQTASPHVTLTGDISLGAAGENVAITPGSNLLLGVLAGGAHAAGLTWIQAVGQVTASAFVAYQGVAGTPTAALASGATGVKMTGLNFSPAVGGGGGGAVVSELAGIVVQPFATAFTGVVTKTWGLRLKQLFFGASSDHTTTYGIEIENYSEVATTDAYQILIRALAWGTNRYGINMEDIAGGTIARLLELGPSTPHLRLLATGEWSPAINSRETPLYVVEADGSPVVKTLRQFKTKDGAGIGAGDRVVVAV